MELRNKKWTEEQFLAERQKVLASWKTGSDKELDFENEDILIISRKFTIDGKSSIKIRTFILIIASYSITTIEISTGISRKCSIINGI